MMGADVHIVLGRLKLLELPSNPDTAESDAQALSVFGFKNVSHEAFELCDCPSDVEFNRNYDLFSWLAGIIGDIKPYYLGYDRTAKTEQFLEWLDTKLIEADRATGKHVGWYSYDSIFDKYDLGNHNRIIHIVRNLKDFDYDEVIEIEDENSAWDNPRYYRDPDGKSYRQTFGEDYFKFLDYCVTQNYHFVIFGFDN